MRRIPYPAWRRLIEFLWQDASFMYCVCPRFVWCVEALLLLNAEPPEQSANGARRSAGQESDPAKTRAASVRHRRSSLANMRMP